MQKTLVQVPKMLHFMEKKIKSMCISYFHLCSTNVYPSRHLVLTHFQKGNKLGMQNKLY